jgi:hypothetical protein
MIALLPVAYIVGVGVAVAGFLAIWGLTTPRNTL